MDTGIYSESSNDFESNAVAIYIQMLDFDPETERAEVAFYPSPTEDIAKQLSSSVILERGITFLADSQNGEAEKFGAGDHVGAVEATIDVLMGDYPERASDAFYPFDRYVMDSFAQVQIEHDPSEFRPVQTFDYFYESSVPGFDIAYQGLGAFDSGYAGNAKSLD